MKDVMEVGVKPIVISDHLPIYVIKKKSRNCRKREWAEYRHMKNYSIEELETIIRLDARWGNFWKENVSVDELWNIMYTIFIDAIDVLCPTVRRLVQTDRHGWVTAQVKEAIKEKNVLYRRARERETDADWEAFRLKKKLTAKFITETKCNVTKNKLRENYSNPQKFWRQINSEILGRKERNGIEVLKNADGQCLIGKEAADYINNYHAKMGKSNDALSRRWDEQTINMDKKIQDFVFRVIELLEVHQLIKDIDITKASGVDKISTRILKDCFIICEYELTYLCNSAIHNMKFPVDWKRSIITPIPKSGDKLNPGNWRPINNLCVPGKLLEKCVYRQVEECMEKNCYVCNNQHGFRKGRGTDTAVMELVRELFAQINNNAVSSILFLDYSRAFNTVDHEILLKKMSMYGFSDCVCNWFRDYFKDRTQFTKIGTVLSYGVPIEHGVYQGSPLGPLLFIIYINDIVRMHKDVFCNMYF